MKEGAGTNRLVEDSVKVFPIPGGFYWGYHQGYKGKRYVSFFYIFVPMQYRDVDSSISMTSILN